MRLKRTYSSREVAAMTGLSARQLQLWDLSGLIAASIPSHPTEAGGHTERRYTPIELFELLVLAELRKRGFTVHQLHAIVDALDEHFGVSLFEATGGGGRLRLLTDDKSIYARLESGALHDLLENPAQPLLVVGDERSLKELGGRLRSRKKPAP